MALAHRDGRRSIFPTRPRQVYDITGAGDMVMSVLGMALAAGADYDLAIRLANIAGGLEVEKIGVATVTRDEILRDLLRPAAPAAIEKSCRATCSGTNSNSRRRSASTSPSPTAASTCCTPATSSTLHEARAAGGPAGRRPQQRCQRAGAQGRRSAPQRRRGARPSWPACRRSITSRFSTKQRRWS